MNRPTPLDSSQPHLLGQLLLSKQLLADSDLDKALHLQSQLGGRLGALLMRIGAISEDNLLPVLAEQLSMPLLDSHELPLDPTAWVEWLESSGIDMDWLLDQELLIWEAPDGVIHFAAKDPLLPELVEITERLFASRPQQWRLIHNHELDRWLEALKRARYAGQRHTTSSEHLRELAEDAPVIEFVNNLLSQAVDQRASDIHIEPEENLTAIRYRIDGILYSRFRLPLERAGAVASRLKLISGMDIAERRLPQDGRLGTRVSGAEMDIRVSALPGVHGESIVMRLLPKERQELKLERLGYEADHLSALKQMVNEPHGIVLVTGPTGSGKSTTLYGSLETINDGKRKIITVEDPVEYQLKGITQVQTHSEIGLTFARALRSILRQDPDVIMIGEIRDLETAEIAIQASLTGHLVLATLHTNDAVSAFTRLIDMGIEPFLVAAPIRAVLAQRLVRRLCKHCAKPAAPPSEALWGRWADALPAAIMQQPAQWKEAVGCPHCHGIGYSGRCGIYEVVETSPDMQSLIIQSAPTTEMAALATRQGYRTLRMDGFIKARNGVTSLDEVLRVTSA